MQAQPHTKTATDYQRIAAAIEFVQARLVQQPGLEELAAHLQLSPHHLQRLFSRWAGVSPKRFLQILTVERAKPLLANAGPLLEVSDRLGLSSASRLYDHFVTLEAVTPGEFKSGGAGLHIDMGVHDTPFGRAFIAVTPRGICRLAFVNDPGEGNSNGEAEQAALARHWPQAQPRWNPRATQAVMAQVFDLRQAADRPLSLLVAGTNFQVNVWRALLRIPPGQVSSYAELAADIGKPRAARAVGQAVGANPLAFVIPCHRVIRAGGGLGGYHWGVTRKQAIQAWELAQQLTAEPAARPGE